jgi:bifunctional non-homologous end joining protein LigD
MTSGSSTKGTLLSWAIPKGPSLDPKIKRLAMHVEDHPVEYGTFEGVIPEGYGAGIVMLWDRGTWTPETDDVDAALAKGDLKFTLDGYKLKGSWVLVRTRGYTRRSSRDRMAGPDRAPDSGRSWLLIKHRDEWSGDLDIAEFRTAQREECSGFSTRFWRTRTPNVWRHEPPVEGGATGAMLLDVIQRAARLKAERLGEQKQPKARAAKPRSKTRVEALKRGRKRSLAITRSSNETDIPCRDGPPP